MGLRTKIDYLPALHWMMNFATEKECVYYAVRNESLNVIQVNLRP